MLRQIEKLAVMLAARIRSGDELDRPELLEALTEAQSLTALTPSTAARVPLHALLNMLGPPERILRMGLLVAGEGEHPVRARALIDAAVERDPSLASPELSELLDALRGQVSEL